MDDFKSWLEQQAGGELPAPTPTDGLDLRQWLVTDGTGSFASGTLAGVNTSRYHALLVASMTPPVDRQSRLMRFEERANGEQLSTSMWRSGAVFPLGYKQLKGFAHEPCPSWLFQTDKGQVIKQITMLPGQRRTIVGYTWLGTGACRLELDVIVNHRSMHGERTRDDWHPDQQVEASGVAIDDLQLTWTRGNYELAEAWHEGYRWPEEFARGKRDWEDCLRSGILRVELQHGESVTVTAGFEAERADIHQAVRATWMRKTGLLTRAGKNTPVARALVLAAEQFCVHRQSTDSASVLAGYPWFNDWGRDTMISLPGLTLSTGRPELAASILRTFGHYLSEGMLPNCFPDQGETPAYNTADATLWWGWALWHYHLATGDRKLVEEQLPLLKSVVEHHLDGTRYGIKVDEDGLLAVGTPDVQLTWMDAKCGDLVVTPRDGKPVEINALWYNFLRVLDSFEPGGKYRELAERVQLGFEKFWNGEYLFDVIRRDGSTDASLRPNQLVALSLPFPILDKERGALVLEAVERELMTPYGLRTLSPKDLAYQGRYGGATDSADQYHRDLTYHQGTVWPWLLGWWADARRYVHGPGKISLSPELERHLLQEAALGTVSEIFDGDPPHRAVGCFAQAWSVAELLRTHT
jgi:predicted glycogen debranching enzyme